MKQNYILDIDNICILAEDILREFRDGVIILQGDLAAGKTTLVKAIAKKTGCDDEVTSPTFSLQHCYGHDLFHYDIYNHGVEHFISVGMLEELEKDGLHLVEWGDEKLIDILQNAGIDTIVIEIKKNTDNTREYRVKHAHT